MKKKKKINTNSSGLPKLLIDWFIDISIYQYINIIYWCPFLVCHNALKMSAHISISILMLRCQNNFLGHGKVLLKGLGEPIILIFSVRRILMYFPF